VVNRAAPVNARQLEVLKWIADGCPDGVMKDYTYKTTAIALQGRRLVAVTRKRGVWQAQLTAAGSYYLEHGRYPEDLQAAAHTVARGSLVIQQLRLADGQRAGPVAASSPGSASRGARTDVLAERLVAQVMRASGVIEVDTEDDEIDYEQLIRAARRAPNLPFGKQLRIRSVGPYGSDRSEIYLDEDFSVRIGARPVPVPQRVAAYHPAVAAYRADADRHEVSGESFGRASRILQALAAEAARRGYRVTSVGRHQPQLHSEFRRSLTDGQIRITIDGFAYPIRIRELGRRGGSSLSYTAHQTLPRWQAVRPAEFLPSGVLQLTIDSGYRRDRRPAEFKDTPESTVEDLLPVLLRELEIRAREDSQRKQEQEQQAAQKRLRWERAMEQSRHEFREAGRIEELTRQLEAWRLAADLDGYLSAMREQIGAITSDTERAAAESWLTWISEYRSRIDPLRHSLRTPPDRKPSNEDLKPFLHGWSPYGPDL
jgi:hypothetical protein